MSTINRIRAINRTICNIAGFLLSVTVMIPTDKDPINVYKRKIDANTMGISFYLSYPCFLTLELPKDYNYTPYDPLRKINITIANQEVVVDAFERFIKVFDRDDVFYLQGGKLCMYQLKPSEHYVTAKIADHFIEFRPCIVEDRVGNVYEGGEVFFNQSHYSAKITHKEIKALYKAIKKADIFIYSQMLLNYLGTKIMFPSDEEKADVKKTISRLDSLEDKVHVKEGK